MFNFFFLEFFSNYIFDFINLNIIYFRLPPGVSQILIPKYIDLLTAKFNLEIVPKFFEILDLAIRFLKGNAPALFFSFVLCYISFLVVTSRSPVMCLVFLINFYIIIGFLTYLIGFHFISLSFLSIFIGGVAVLYLFAVALINYFVDRTNLALNIKNLILVILILQLIFSYYFFFSVYI